MSALTTAQLFTLRGTLRPLAAPAIAQLEDQHYIGGSDDEGLNWCSACAKREVERLVQADPDGHYFVGCSLDQNSDQHPPSCERCGKQLDSDFTEYALEEALRDMKGRRLFVPKGTSEWQAARCLQIVEALGSYDFEDDKELVLAARRFVSRLERALERLVLGSPPRQPTMH